MHVIFFETAIVSRKTDGDLLIALFNGSIEHGAAQQCVALLTCKEETAIALSSELKAQTEQRDDES